MLASLAGRAGELKSQGAAEAARDPNSKVTADDAAQVMMDEAKKAGAGAYRFDPDASPEEKAAVAAASIPAGLHRQKPVGVAIATDIDDGTPDQYDLPPPEKGGGALSSPTASGSQANGHLPSGEKEFYEKTVGWAPRFGTGGMTEDEANASLLDHTTYLESKLDDRLFGDWYHNTAVIIFASIASWIVAMLGGGLGWLVIVMACCGTYYRTSIRRVRRNFRDDVHRDLAKAKLETETETLEWINTFLVKFWPIFAPELCKTIVASVDQILSTSTPAFLDSLRLGFFTLGTKPPRLEHVKTYPKAEDDIVLMDWKFSFTPNDVMDLTARQLKDKINPKVILEVRVGMGVLSKALKVIVEDFAFSGVMRVKVKLQIPYPHVEKVEICFLGPPDIDYVCKPLGGETLGFDINFIPGLEIFIKEQINGTLAPIMYDPNVFPIEIAKMLSGTPVDQAIGVLAVTLHGAQNLKNPDALSGPPDPYVVVSFNSREKLGKTKIVKENANPRWNETVYVIVTSLTDALTMQVFDYNELRKDKDLGTATFALDRLEEIPEHENLQLEITAGGKQRGLLQCDVRFFPVLEPLKLTDGTIEPVPESNTGIARFVVEQAKDLDGSKSMVGALNPYAVLLLNGKEIKTSKSLKRTNRPVWEDASKEFLVTDRKAARLGLVLKDQREVMADQVIGAYQVKLDEMLRMVEQGKEWFHLSGAATGSIKLMLQWKPVALKGVTGTSGGYITPIGVMRLHFQSARDLKNVETMGKSDPYVRVLLSGVEKGKTVTFQNNLDPDWDEVVYVPMHSTRERLTLEVMDYQKIGKDRSLGFTELSAADYIHEDENGQYIVHDHKTPMSQDLRTAGKGKVKGKLNFTAAFYPVLNVIDPQEEEDDRLAAIEAERSPTHASSASKSSNIHSRNISKASLGEGSRKSTDGDPVAAANSAEQAAGKVDPNLARTLSMAQQEQGAGAVKEMPKLRLTAGNLTQYETGLLVIKLIDGELSRPNLHLEILMDDMLFPSYSSSRTNAKKATFGETGDAIVRELDVSRVTLRLVEKVDKKGEDSEEYTLAKLVDDTLPTLERCLYKPTELLLKGSDGSTNKITVSMKYLPIKMHLDPSESMNNMGTLRVNLLDGTDLPAADRNGFSDPFVKFELNGEPVYKSKVQKKTLQPVWNESFELSIPSRTAAKFSLRVMDWDLAGEDDFLGAANVNLTELDPMQSKDIKVPLNGKSGSVKLRLLFKSTYVTRARQGTSAFGTAMGPAGKVIGAPVKGVTKVGEAVGGGVLKSATFLRHGFKSSRDIGYENSAIVDTPTAATFTNGEAPVPSIEAPLPSIETAENGPADRGPAIPSTPSAHNRSTSFGSKSITSAFGGMAGKADAASGTASFQILSASGFPQSTKVQVYIKQITTKGSKELHKTKAIKLAGGPVTWDSESFRAPCEPDAQFQVVVKDHTMFGGDDLGEALFFIDDSAAGSEKQVAVGGGSVTLRTSFQHTEADASSIKDSRSPFRKNFLKKDASRGNTPG